MRKEKITFGKEEFEKELEKLNNNKEPKGQKIKQKEEERNKETKKETNCRNNVNANLALRKVEENNETTILKKLEEIKEQNEKLISFYEFFKKETRKTKINSMIVTKKNYMKKMQMF
jgi:hypothetical protein